MNLTSSVSLTCALVLACATHPASALAAVVFVDDSAPAGGNGQSWATAYRFLSDGIAFAAVPANGVTEIRVGQGSHRPDQSAAMPAGTNNRNTAFQPVSNVLIRGGFAGTGAADPNAQNPVAFPTILTANIGNAGLATDNSYNVIRTVVATVNAVIDGVTIRDGNANFDGLDYQRFGGGIHQPGGSLTLTGCVVTANSAIGNGGGAFVWGTLTVQSCTFSGNSCIDNTGGAVMIANTGSGSFTNTAFESNSARFAGGGVAVWQRPASFNGCTFSANSTTGPGGGLFSTPSGGAIWAKGGPITFPGNPCVFTANTAGSGGAVFLDTSTVSFNGASFASNDATTESGGAIKGFVVSLTCTNCDFAENTAVLRGGAVHLEDAGTQTFTDCNFTLNIAGRLGGGVNAEQNSLPTFLGCTFTENVANGTNEFEGGGGASAGNGTFDGCTFEGNHSERDGGGLKGAILTQNCTFVGNSADFGGGGLYTGKTIVRDCDMRMNQAFWGAGLYIRGSTGGTDNKPWVSRCTFDSNVAGGFGGGVYLTNFPKGVFAQCRITGNSAGQRGGGVMREHNNTSHFVSCLINGNSAPRGGGASTFDNGSTLNLVNCLVAGNTATIAGGGLHWESSLFTVSNTILWQNTDPSGSGEAAQASGPSHLIFIDHSCVQGWTGALGGAGNFGCDPLLLDSDGADNDFGTDDDNPLVAPTSPCLDVGNGAALPADESDLDGDMNVAEPSPLDLLGSERVVNFVVDVGAAEGSEVVGPGVYIGPSGGSWFTASNWAGNVIPGARTDVFIDTLVLIGQSGALADSVQIVSGGSLQIASGSLSANDVSVEAGGSLALSGAALLEVTSLLVESAASLNWTGGEISIDGGTLSVASALAVGCAGDAALELLSNATVAAASLTICIAGELRGNGTVGCNVTNAGLVEPGASPGTLVIEGSFEQTSTGTLEMEIASYAPDAKTDLLIIEGVATLDGALLTTVSDPSSPDVVLLTVLSAEAILGTFATVQQRDPLGDFIAALYQTADSIEIGVAVPGPRVHVQASALPGGSGQSWADAFDDLQSAILAAQLTNGSITEIWVAAGTYVPSEPASPQLAFLGPRAATFRLRDGLAIYGGFAGDETSLEERDPIANPTVLSGDLAGDDDGSESSLDENSFHVVTSLDAALSAVLDGVIVRAGNAFPSGEETGRGGGAFVDGGAATFVGVHFVDNRGEQGGGLAAASAAPVLVDCVFTANRGDNEGGGGLAAVGGALSCEGCVFEDNESDQAGGAVLLVDVMSNFVDGLFGGNLAFLSGGAIAAGGGSLSISGCTFTSNGNDETSSGGAIEIVSGAATIVDSEFAGNEARNGGALALALTGDDVIVEMSDFDNNTAELDGGAVSNGEGNPTFLGCTFSGNSAKRRGGAVASSTEGKNDPTSAPIFESCAFTGNAVLGGPFGPGVGGALSFVAGVEDPKGLGPGIIDCTFEDNAANAEGGAIWINRAIVTLASSSFAGNDAPFGSAVANTFNGEVRGELTMRDDDELVSTAVVSAGFSDEPVGVLTCDGAWRLVERGPDFDDQPTLLVDLGGNSRAEFDRVVTGEAELIGGLFVHALDGFIPRVGDEFVIIETPVTTGAFALASFPAVPVGALMEVRYDPDGVRLVLAPALIDLVFADPAVVGISGVPVDAVVLDADNDGDPDLAVLVDGVLGSSFAGLYVLRNEGVDGGGAWLGFTAVLVSNAVGSSGRGLVAGQFNGDAFADLVVASGGGIQAVVVMVNSANGSVSFAAPAFSVLAFDPRAVAAGNLIGSAAPDLAIAAGDNTLRVLQNSGAASFAPASSSGTGIAPRAVAIVDLNGIGQPEILVACTGNAGNPPKLAVHSVVSGAPQVPTLYSAPAGANGIAIGDLDGDGFPDVVVSGGAAGAVGVSINPGDGTTSLQLPVTLVTGSGTTSPVVLDADADGDLDISLVAEGSLPGLATVRLLRNDLNGGATATFSVINDLPTDGEPALVRALDVDGDGKADLAAVNTGAAGAAFGSMPAVAVLLNASAPKSILGDLDGNGIVDGGDLGLLLGAWGTADEAADLNDDGTVDGADFGILLGAWSS